MLGSPSRSSSSSSPGARGGSVGPASGLLRSLHSSSACARSGRSLHALLAAASVILAASTVFLAFSNVRRPGSGARVELLRHQHAAVSGGLRGRGLSSNPPAGTPISLGSHFARGSFKLLCSRMWFAWQTKW